MIKKKELDAIPIIVNQHSHSLLSTETGKARGLHLFPSLFQYSSRISITGWLIFSHLGYYKIINPPIGRKFFNYSLEILQTYIFRWLTENYLSENIKRLKEEKLITISHKSGCTNSLDFTFLGNKLYRDECTKKESSFIIVYPSLAGAIGLIESIILVRIHNAKYKKEEFTWSISGMHKALFSHEGKGVDFVFSERTFERGIARLKKLKLLNTYKAKGTLDRHKSTNSYVIDYEVLETNYFPRIPEKEFYVKTEAENKLISVGT